MVFGSLALCLILAATAFAAVGGLAQKAGTAGCIADDNTVVGVTACTDGVALDGAAEVTISPDGTSAYVASIDGGTLAIFDRNTATGALTQKVGSAGCIAEDNTVAGVTTCTDGKALAGARSVAVSPDGTSVYVASEPPSNAVAIFDRNTSTGALTQKAGTGGCISDDGTAGACADGGPMIGAHSVTISPDGTSLYVASAISNAVTVFDRNTTSGALTQKAGTAGCISETGTAGACTDGTALVGAASVTSSPDGSSVYATSPSSSAITIFDRNTTTGSLTQKAGTAGCISDTGTAGACIDGAALSAARSITVSPDGDSVYVASIPLIINTASTSGAVAIFDRNTSNGALTQKGGAAGCIADDTTFPGATTCTDGTALKGATAVTASPDGDSVYVASQNTSDAVAVLDRNASTGALTQKAGTAGCIVDDNTFPGLTTCADGTALGDASSVAVSPDGSSAYVTAQVSDAVAIFDRDLPPQTTIDGGPSGPTSDNTPTFNFSSSDAGSTFECRVDGASFAACSGPGGSDTTVGLADGPHTFTVRAIDPASTPDPTPATQAFTVDTAAPDTTITRKPKAKLKTKGRTANAKVAFDSEAGATFECKLDKADFEPCSSPFKVKAKSKRGKGKKHTISVQATDAAGNFESEPATVKFTVIKRN
jgi:DNA-binding beta-propeller fold protein YncE